MMNEAKVNEIRKATKQVTDVKYLYPPVYIGSNDDKEIRASRIVYMDVG